MSEIRRTNVFLSKSTCLSKARIVQKINTGLKLANYQPVKNSIVLRVVHQVHTFNLDVGHSRPFVERTVILKYEDKWLISQLVSSTSRFHVTSRVFFHILVKHRLKTKELRPSKYSAKTQVRVRIMVLHEGQW